ncbi:MAG: LysR substrate-binding domain-containing protein [Myxococcota bacterium]
MISRRRSHPDGLRVESLVRSPTSIVCGVGHPLYGSETVDMAIQMVGEGSLLGVFPDVMIRCQINHGELHRIPSSDPLPEPELVAVTRPSSASHPAAEALLSVLEPALEESLEAHCAT